MFDDYQRPLPESMTDNNSTILRSVGGRKHEGVGGGEAASGFFHSAAMLLKSSFSD